MDANAAVTRELDIHVIHDFRERDEADASILNHSAAMAAPDTAPEMADSAASTTP